MNDGVGSTCTIAVAGTKLRTRRHVAVQYRQHLNRAYPDVVLPQQLSTKECKRDTDGFGGEQHFDQCAREVHGSGIGFDENVTSPKSKEEEGGNDAQRKYHPCSLSALYILE